MIGKTRQQIERLLEEELARLNVGGIAAIGVDDLGDGEWSVSFTVEDGAAGALGIAEDAARQMQGDYFLRGS